jgi:glycosyltransferase involved in cell wall biosynthesis
MKTKNVVEKQNDPSALSDGAGDHTPKYSIVLPVFKTKHFKETFESVVGQSFDDFEIVVMNDEADGDISWVCQNNKTRYFENHPRLGPTQNWNRGISLCRGEFVLVFSDDDVLAPNFLAEVDRFLREHNFAVDIVRVLRELIDESGNTLAFSAPGRPVETLAEFVYNFISSPGRQCLQDIIFRRQTALQIGGFKNFPRGWGADILFSVEIAAVKNKIGTVNEVLVKYRKHSGSLSHPKNPDFYTEVIAGDYGYYKGVLHLLKDEPGAYAKLALSLNEKRLQMQWDWVYTEMLVNFGIFALLRRRRIKPAEVSEIKSLRRTIPIYLYARLKKIPFLPKKLFLRTGA